jgi:energy-coupling factor transporter ATP-binding protein EcfA2
VDIHSKREIYRLLRDYVRADNTVIMFCTEVLEVYEAADRAHVVVDGGLSRQIVVGDYPHVEALATEISRMERHARDDGGARRNCRFCQRVGQTARSKVCGRMFKARGMP